MQFDQPGFVEPDGQSDVDVPGRRNAVAAEGKDPGADQVA